MPTQWTQSLEKTNFGCNFKYVFILVSRYYVTSRTHFYLDVEFPAVNVGNSSKHTAFYLGLTCISSQGGASCVISSSECNLIALRILGNPMKM